MSGVVALGCGLGAAELLAGAVQAWRAPLISVGDRVVDATPPALKDWAISTFGTANKAVMLGVVVVVLIAAAAAIGVAATRRGLRVAVVGSTALGLVGAAASLGRGGTTSGVVPSLVGAAVAALVFTWLLPRGAPGLAWSGPAIQASVDPVSRAASEQEAGADEPARTPSQLADAGRVDDASLVFAAATRRRFLGAAAGLGAGAVAAGAAGRWLAQRSAVTAARVRTVLPRPATSLPPVASEVRVGVRGVTPFLTPNADFFRIDTALTVPQVDPADWQLRVHGRVEQELTLSYDELLDRPMIEADLTIACVSNEVGGSLIGTARWLGCRLDDLLAEAGIDPSADQVVGRSVDGFTAGFPTALLDGRDALVAVGMNGEPLPIRHGFPARLVVPGVYGYVSATKWLSDIELTRFDEFEGYWIPRGWAVEGPVKTQSRIDTPRDGRRVDAGSDVAIAGVAWAPISGITRVQVQVDDEPWQDATLGAEHAATTWRQWTLPWRPDPGEHRIRVRATDAQGRTQTETRTPVAPDGASGWHTIQVTAS